MSHLILETTTDEQDEGEVRVCITQKGRELLDGKPVNATPIAAHRTVRLTAKGRAYLDALDHQRAEGFSRAKQSEDSNA
jgi:DNA-binding MarR family transcriptional regulator